MITKIILICIILSISFILILIYPFMIVSSKCSRNEENMNKYNDFHGENKEK